MKHRAINMVPQPPLREAEAANWDFFLKIPETDRKILSLGQVKDVQLLQPLFEFSGACSGCGETPYIKLMTQLFGDRMMIANATGCSSIYGGNLPTTPYCQNDEGRGPAWSNSLFEDNAEFGLGMRLAVDKQNEYARELVWKLGFAIGENLAQAILNADQKTRSRHLRPARARRRSSRRSWPASTRRKPRDLLSRGRFALVKKSVWIVGGDGWAYDIGYGGLDHVLASGRNVNVLVLDTEVYSNTGGQASKSTPRGAVAKFAAGGKPVGKKDLAMMAVSYGSVYVARVAMGASDMHTLKAFLEAEAFNGPSLIIAYSHCIAHGYDLATAWISRRPPSTPATGRCSASTPTWWRRTRIPSSWIRARPPSRSRSTSTTRPATPCWSRAIPKQAKRLLELAQEDVASHWKLYDYMAHEPLRRRGGEEMIDLSKTIDLSTTYLGLKLKNPLVASSSPMCGEVGNIRRLEDAGAAAVVLQSLFEEQIEQRKRRARPLHRAGLPKSAPNPRSHFPELAHRVMGPEAYLEHIAKCKQAVQDSRDRQPQRHLPRRLARATPSRWQQAGADALELNIYHIPVRPRRHRRTGGAAVHRPGAGRQSRSHIPVAVKLGPYFSSMANMAKQAGRRRRRRPGALQPLLSAGLTIWKRWKWFPT